MNDLDDDFTPEEKALLKREMRHRINRQRMREQSPLPAAVIFGVLALLAKVAATRVQPVVLDVVGNVFIGVAVILLVITLLKRK